MEPEASVEDRDEGVEGVSEPPRGGPQTRVLPFNSKRLTAAHIQGIAKVLELPITASASDVRQKVEGKLLEQGREPTNIQVQISVPEEGGADKLVLRDESGPFLEVELTASSWTKSLRVS